ncbi:hypothetical protein CHUAL_003134 [Chamberlinius hualienensis]
MTLRFKSSKENYLEKLLQQLKTSSRKQNTAKFTSINRPLIHFNLLINSKRSTMGALVSYFWAPRVSPNLSAEFKDDPSLDQLDSKTQLTARQKRVIEETWNLVEKDIRGNGVDFFIAFFKVHPTYQSYFKSFAEVPMDKLKENRKLHAHAFSVMHAIASMVSNLDDIDCLAEILTKTGLSHGGRNIKIEHFENLALVFVDFLQEKLGSILTPFGRKAWAQALTVINSVIKPALEEANKS